VAGNDRAWNKCLDWMDAWDNKIRGSLKEDGSMFLDLASLKAQRYRTFFLLMTAESGIQQHASS
jgi:hypothetical protein